METVRRINHHPPALKQEKKYSCKPSTLTMWLNWAGHEIGEGYLRRSIGINNSIYHTSLIEFSEMVEAANNRLGTNYWVRYFMDEDVDTAQSELYTLGKENGRFIRREDFRDHITEQGHEVIQDHLPWFNVENSRSSKARRLDDEIREMLTESPLPLGLGGHTVLLVGADKESVTLHDPHYNNPLAYHKTELKKTIQPEVVMQINK